MAYEYLVGPRSGSRGRGPCLIVLPYDMGKLLDKDPSTVEEYNREFAVGIGRILRGDRSLCQ